MKIILVKGITNSHKTSSTRKFTSNHVIFGPNSIVRHTPNSPILPIGSLPASGDFIAVGEIHKNGNVINIGIASAGDSHAIVLDRLKYFHPLNLDIIVICSKSYGGSVKAVVDEIYCSGGIFYGATLHATSTIDFPSKTDPLIPVDEDRVVFDIFTYI